MQNKTKMIDLRSDKSTKSKYCCEAMKEQVEYFCDMHKSPFECPDNLIYHSKKSNEYGLIVHDGGSSFVHIKYCPFCGTELSISIK